MAKARRVPDRSEGGRSFPATWAPKGLSRIEAAQHVNVSATMWDEMVRDGRMPQPKVIGSRIVWDREKVERFFEALPDRGPNTAETEGWDDWE